MKVQLNEQSPSAFHVPAGIYPGQFQWGSPAKKAFCRFCPLAKQVSLYFSVPVKGWEQDGIVATTKCVANPNCANHLGHFLTTWLEDRFEDYAEPDGSCDLDLLYPKRADLIVEHRPDPRYPTPYSKLVVALPPGRLSE